MFTIENKRTKWIMKMMIGIAIQASIIGGMLFAILYQNQTANNIAIFVSIILFVMAIVTLAVSMFIPAEHAKATKIEVIEYNQWTPYRIWLRTLMCLYIGLSLLAAAFGVYWYATVFIVTALSMGIWPNYIDKVDQESKQFMMETLAGKT